MPPFERFTHDQIALKRDPWITLQKRGTISLNRSAYVLLGSPSAVELLYDADNRIVGMRQCDPRDRDAVHVRLPTGKESGPFVLSAMAFLRFYGVDLDGSRRWQAFLDGEMLCIDLRAPGVPVTSNRARQIHDSK